MSARDISDPIRYNFLKEKRKKKKRLEFKSLFNTFQSLLNNQVSSQKNIHSQNYSNGHRDENNHIGNTTWQVILLRIITNIFTRRKCLGKVFV